LSRRTSVPRVDLLESRQLLNASPVHLHSEPLRHHRAAVVESARHAHRAPAEISVAATDGFHVVPSPAAPQGVLAGTAAIAADDIWAVGSDDVQTAPPAFDSPLAEHFDGKSWSVVPIPKLSSGGPNPPEAQFHGVAAAASNDVWAVGDGPAGALIEHWNGTVWSVVNRPKVAGDLVAVVAISANDAWAVGQNGSGGALVEHWNGTAWKVVRNTGALSGLRQVLAISADSPTDVWALGVNDSASFLLHFNGTTWSRVAATGGISLTAISPTDVWIAGSVGVKGFPNGDDGFNPRAEHWDGKTLSVVPTPAPPLPTPSEFESSAFDAIAAVSANDIVAVGTAQTLNRFGSPLQTSTLIEQWNGTSWSIVRSPNPSTSGNFLNAVTVLNDGTVVAVGFQENDNFRAVFTPLIVRN
jgi:hypothetical protein